jgi:tRNA pseudouridine55 synthase
VTDLPAAGGVVPVDKPAGPTSHDVVAAARRALGTRRVGHTGTLDPFATGLLLLCVGPATRLAQFLTGLIKRYVAEVRLGVRTSTDDPEGEIEGTSDAWRGLARDDVERVLDAFRGRVLQTPPRYSAKKVGGESAHYRTRRGEDVGLAPVEVEVHALELSVWSPPDLELRVACSAGTYVRALARDVGDALGVGAHLTALRRTAIGSFTVDRALSIDALFEPDAVRRAWITPAAALEHLPAVHVGPEDAARLAQGQAVPITEATTGAPGGAVAVLSNRELVAVAAREGDRLRPRKVFVGGGE